jgi:hypothetical protein
VARACNPSHSGGRDQEDQDSKPSRAKLYPILKTTKKKHKKGLVDWLKIQPHYCKKKKKKRCKKI